MTFCEHAHRPRALGHRHLPRGAKGTGRSGATVTSYVCRGDAQPLGAVTHNGGLGRDPGVGTSPVVRDNGASQTGTTHRSSHSSRCPDTGSRTASSRHDKRVHSRRKVRDVPNSLAAGFGKVVPLEAVARPRPSRGEFRRLPPEALSKAGRKAVRADAAQHHVGGAEGEPWRPSLEIGRSPDLRFLRACAFAPAQTACGSPLASRIADGSRRMPLPQPGVGARSASSTYARSAAGCRLRRDQGGDRMVSIREVGLR